MRVKHVGPFTAKVYAISHYMRELPPTKSKAAVIAMDTDKSLSWRLLRDLELKQIRDALRDGFAMNGYTDRAKIDQFLGAFTKPRPREDAHHDHVHERVEEHDHRRRGGRHRDHPGHRLHAAAHGASGSGRSISPSSETR